MKIYKHEAYHNGKKLQELKEVMVTKVNDEYIEFSEIYGWSVGSPHVSGKIQTANRDDFEKWYPHVAEYVQAP